MISSEKTYEPSYYLKAESKKVHDDPRYSFLTDFIKGHLLSGSNIVEIGCGTGELAKNFSDFKYFGFDISSYAINEAQGKHFPNAQFGVGSKDEISLPDGFASAVISLFVIEHLEKPQKILDEMVRVTEKGGYLCLMAPNLEMPFSSLNALRHLGRAQRLILCLKRVGDYLLRLVGIWRFRTLKSNFTMDRGRYEKIDDDLLYIASSYEIISYLERHGFAIEYIDKTGEGGFKGMVKKIISYLPAMRYYGKVLFVILKKR